MYGLFFAENVEEPVQEEAAPVVRRAVAGRNNRVRNRFANRNQENAGAGNFAGLFSEITGTCLICRFQLRRPWTC